MGIKIKLLNKETEDSIEIPWVEDVKINYINFPVVRIEIIAKCTHELDFFIFKNYSEEIIYFDRSKKTFLCNLIGKDYFGVLPECVLYNEKPQLKFSYSHIGIILEGTEYKIKRRDGLMEKHKEYLEGQKATMKAAKDDISEGEKERVERLKNFLHKWKDDIECIRKGKKIDYDWQIEMIKAFLFKINITWDIEEE